MDKQRSSGFTAGSKILISFLLGFSLVSNGYALAFSSIWVQTGAGPDIFGSGHDPAAMISPLLSFTNSTPILIPATQNSIAGISSPYPATINVPTSGTISALTVTLNGFHHTQQKDIDMLLIGPTGASFVFMSDVGGAGTGTPAINLTFDDAAATQAPVTVISATSTFKPTNSITGDTFNAPAPGGPYNEAAPAASATFASVFGGTNQQGNWNLYVMDDAGGDFGACDGGWTLNITTAAGAAPTTTMVMSSLNPSLTTNSVTFSAHVSKTSDSSNVTLGTVTFVDNTTSTVLASNVALNGSGNASTSSISGLTERRHLITATYNPDPAFLTSNGTLFQTVDFPTSNPSLATFCNTNPLVVPDAGTSGPAVQYPSHITVSGLPYVVGNVKVTLSNVSHTAAQDMDMLLVSPTGQNMIIVSDSGGNTSNVSLVVYDNAAGQIAAGGAWGAPGTVETKPVDRTAGDTFQSPAPVGPYNSPSPVGTATTASVFGGFAPNGVWSLYVFDDAGGDIGQFAGGWCVNITVPSAAAVSLAGRVFNNSGSGVSGAVVTLTDEGGISREVRTSSLGYYRIENVETGKTYVIGVSSKRYVYASRTVNVTDAVDNLDLVPLE